MKNLKIILITITLIILTSCSDKEIEKNNENVNSNTKKADIKSENKVYNEIADKDVWLKNATSDQLDKIIQEEIRILNTPTSKYLFFEQNSSKKASIEDIKKSGWMELTRGNIYLYWMNKEYSFLNDILSENEKSYSFNKEENKNSFFYLDKDENDFINKVKNKYSDYKLVINDKEFKEISFKNEWKTYSLQMFLPTSMPRDDIDNILSTVEKIKVSINLTK